MYEVFCEKQSKTEAIQSECMQKLEKYMTEIIRLNNIIQEKDQMILNLKLENCDLRDQVTKSRTAGNQATQPVPVCPAETDASTLQTDTHSDANSYSSKLKSNMAPGTSKDESNMFVQTIETKQNVGHVSEVSKTMVLQLLGVQVTH